MAGGRSRLTPTIAPSMGISWPAGTMPGAFPGAHTRPVTVAGSVEVWPPVPIQSLGYITSPPPLAVAADDEGAAREDEEPGSGPENALCAPRDDEAPITEDDDVPLATRNLPVAGSQHSCSDAWHAKPAGQSVSSSQGTLLLVAEG